MTPSEPLLAAPVSPAKISDEKRLGLFYALAGASVLLLYAAFHPINLGFLAWFALVPMLYATSVIRRKRDLFLYGALVGLLFHLIGLAWLALCSPPAWLVTAGLEALYMGLSVLLVSLAQRRTGLPYAICLPLIWAALDFERARFKFFAFPWMMLGQTQHGWDALIQVADLGSFYLIDAVVLAGNGLLLDSLRRARPLAPVFGRDSLSPVLSSKQLQSAWGAFAVLLVSCLIYGSIRWGQVETALKDSAKVLCIQTDFPSRPDPREHVPVTTISRESLKLANAEGAKHKGQYDVMVWPETTWPYPLNREWPASERFNRLVVRALRLNLRSQVYVDSERLMQLPGQLGRDLLLGAVDTEYGMAGWTRKHNSVFWLGADPKKGIVGRYDKVHLVPASEGIPGKNSAVFGWFYRLLKSMVPPGFSVFDPGESPKVFEIRGHKIAPNVCFDVSYPHFIRAATRAGAELHINCSNYSWFRSSQALELAMIQAKFRAIESRRGVVNVVNSGPSVAFDPLGRVIAELPHRRGTERNDGSLLVSTKTTSLRSVYLRVGDAFAWLLVLAAGALLFMAWRGLRPMEPRAEPVVSSS